MKYSFKQGGVKQFNHWRVLYVLIIYTCDQEIKDYMELLLNRQKYSAIIQVDQKGL